MNDVVNLNRFRKRNARDAKAGAAAENRIRFGQTKAEREAARHLKTTRERQHEHNYLQHDPEQRAPVFRKDHALNGKSEDDT